MKVNTVTEAKAQLSALIERVLKGEEVVIARNGKPVAVLVAFTEGRRPRTPGQWKGQVTMADDFDSLPPDVADAFGMENL